MDQVRIRDLRVPTHVGVTEDERSRPQTVIVSIDMDVDLTRAGASDELADTVDYGRATEEVAELVRSSETRLLERLAEEIARFVSSRQGVHGVTVEVAK